MIGNNLIFMNEYIPIQERTFQFAVRIVRFCIFLDENKKAAKRIADQLQRCGTSIGANVAESQSAQSTKDFIHKLEIALKEAKETRYWLHKLLEKQNSLLKIMLNNYCKKSK
ncbi:MAG: hypothetical protein Kow0049_26120 [Stanieria sp.]